MFISSACTKEDSPTVHQFDLLGKKASISLPKDFLPTPSQDPDRSVLFLAESRRANVTVMNMNEPLTAEDVVAPQIVEDTKARVAPEDFLGNSIVSLPGDRKALRLVLKISGENAVVKQIRFFIQGDPGWVVIFTTVEANSNELFPQFDLWVKSFQVS
jgi:hypothetical protein